MYIFRDLDAEVSLQRLLNISFKKSMRVSQSNLIFALFKKKKKCKSSDGQFVLHNVMPSFCIYMCVWRRIGHFGNITSEDQIRDGHSLGTMHERRTAHSF